MEHDSRRERDLVLDPISYAFVQDSTKGKVDVNVGPHKTSLSNTDQPVIFNPRSKSFEPVDLKRAIQKATIAPEGWYVELKNPSKEESKKHPKPGVGSSPELSIGNKVNIPGPISFPLWPGQMVKILQGHRLRSNQYLIVRVYNAEEAQENWDKAIVKTTGDEDTDEKQTLSGINVSELAVGNLAIIKGTDVSFYIPPTGVEVVPDYGGNYVRQAVTLESLEYCVLLDEDGEKRYERGPSVIFPKPTEEFKTNTDGEPVFRAIELNENSGVYVKVIKPYDEYKEGDELFITGKEQMIYFPRAEHAIIKYGKEKIHFAVAIPAGEARYVLDRMTGTIDLVKGPKMFLADPRKQVIVRRILNPDQTKLWFPGNYEALEVNERLQDAQSRETTKGMSFGAAGSNRTQYVTRAALESYEGDSFSRKKKFTEPRTITLNTKYDGAVLIDVWTGCAVQVISKTGKRQVIEGPQPILLEYDQTLCSFELSTGKPKTTDRKIKDVYLRVQNNKISDILNVETRDNVEVSIKVSYRVNFEGDKEKWFNVDNYVKFLCDHVRSIVKNVVRKLSIQEFYANPYDIIRDCIIGKPGEDGNRKGRSFDENGMNIYEVEVLKVAIQDREIQKMINAAQTEAVHQTIELTALQEQLKTNEEKEAIRVQTEELKSDANGQIHEIKLEAVERNFKLEKAKEEKDNALTKIEKDFNLEIELMSDKIAELRREQKKLDDARQATVEEEKLQRKIKEIQEQAKATVEQNKSIQPGLIEALKAVGQAKTLESMGEHLAPLSIVREQSLGGTFNSMFQGTAIQGLLENIDNLGKNKKDDMDSIDNF